METSKFTPCTNEGPDITVENSFSLTRDLISKYFSGNLMELSVFAIHGISSNSWFDLEMMDYLSDTYFIIEPINRKATLILFKDAS